MSANAGAVTASPRRRLIFEASPEYRCLRITVECEKDRDRTSCLSLVEMVR